MESTDDRETIGMGIADPAAIEGQVKQFDAGGRMYMHMHNMQMHVPVHVACTYDMDMDMGMDILVLAAHRLQPEAQ